MLLFVFALFLPFFLHVDGVTATPLHLFIVNFAVAWNADQGSEEAVAPHRTSSSSPIPHKTNVTSSRAIYRWKVRPRSMDGTRCCQLCVRCLQIEQEAADANRRCGNSTLTVFFLSDFLLLLLMIHSSFRVRRMLSSATCFGSGKCSTVLRSRCTFAWTWLTRLFSSIA